MTKISKKKKNIQRRFEAILTSLSSLKMTVVVG